MVINALAKDKAGWGDMEYWEVLAGLSRMGMEDFTE